MPSFNVVGDDDRDDRNYREPARRSRGRSFENKAENGMNLIYVVVIMGVVLLGALWFTQAQPCPTCPEIPACPQVNMSQFSCPDVSCPNLTCPDVSCNSLNTTYYNLTESDCIDYVNEKANLNMTITFLNSRNYSNNVTYQMSKDRVGVYDTTELNTTELAGLVGELIVIETKVN